MGARCAPRLYQLLCFLVRTRAVQVPAPLETARLSLALRVRLRRMRPPGSGMLASTVMRVHSLPLLERGRMNAQVPPNLPSWRRTLLSARSSSRSGTTMASLRLRRQHLCEDQTQGAFLSIPGRRSRRFYRTSEPLFPAPYQIPPGVAPLVQESSTDVKRRPTTYSPSLSSSQEFLLSSACETASWIDLALPACSNFGSRLPADSKPEFERMMLSVGRAVEFLASQVVTALGNHVLAKRVSLLRDPQSTVPVEALSRLRHASLPSSSAAIFPTPLLDDSLSKSCASANDALVKKSLHPPRIPKKVPSGQDRPHPRASSVDRGGESPVTPRSQGSSQHQRSSNSGHRGKKSRCGGQGKGNRSNNNKGSGRKGGGKRHSLGTEQTCRSCEGGGCLSVHWRR